MDIIEITTAVVIVCGMLFSFIIGYGSGYVSATSYLRKKKIITSKKGTYTFTPKDKQEGIF